MTAPNSSNPETERRRCRAGNSAGAAWTAALVLSLLLNVALALALVLNLRARRSDKPNAAPAQAVVGTNTEGMSTALVVPREGMVEVNAEWHWDALAALDLRTLKNRLEEAGCPEHVRRAIMSELVHQEYAPRLREAFDRAQEGFWDVQAVVKSGRRAPSSTDRARAEEAYAILRNERDRRMEELVGGRWNRSGWPEIRDRDEVDPRLSFLSPTQRQQLERQERAVAELRQALRSQGLTGPEEEQRVAELKAVHEAERATFLSPDEALELRLRRSPYDHVVQDLYSFEPTPEERRAIIELHEAHDGNVPAEALSKALGDGRAGQFRRARDNAYESLHKLGTHLQLPEEYILRVYELKVGAEEQARALRVRSDLTSAQKGEALRRLEQVTLGNLDTYLGPDGRDLYLRNGGWWVKALTGPGN